MNDREASAMVGELTDAILRQEEATDLREIRKYACKMERLESQILRSREGVLQLASLLSSPDVLLRANAATMLLGTLKHDEAMRALRELATGDDLYAWGARERIKEWDTHPERYTSRLTDDSRKPDLT